MEPMEKSNRANRFSTEVRARAVRMIFEHEHEYANQSAAIMAIAPKIGCGRDTLRRWVKKSDIDNLTQKFTFIGNPRLPPKKLICKLNLYLGFTPANRPHPNRSVAFWRVPSEAHTEAYTGGVTGVVTFG